MEDNKNHQLTNENQEKVIQLLSAQADLQRKELDIREKEITNAHEYGMKALESHEKCIISEKESNDKFDKRNTYTSAAIIIIILLLIAYAMHLNFTNLLVEIFRYALVAIGSYFWGKGKGKNEGKG